MTRHTTVLVSALVALSVSACAGGYGAAEIAYVRPARYAYVLPMDRVVVLTRAALVDDGWTVFRVQRVGRDRILWARHGPDQRVRIYAHARGDRVYLRGERDERPEGGHGRLEGWVRRGDARHLMASVDSQLRSREHARGRGHRSH
jgi:hypothetical protein